MFRQKRIWLAGFLVFGFLFSTMPVEFHETLAVESKKAAKYFCPMHPHYTSDKPGDCPICHMRLVPFENEKVEITNPKDPHEVCMMHQCPMLKSGEPCPMLVIAKKGEVLQCPACKMKFEVKDEPFAGPLPAGYATVMISPQKQQLIGIKTGVVEKKMTEKVIRAAGRVAYDPELYQAEAEYLQSLKSSQEEWAKKILESATVKLVRMGLNAQMIEELSKQEGPDKSLLYAIADAPAWIYANIYEYELPLVKVGDGVAVEGAPGVGTKLYGVLKAIDSSVDAQTRTVRVRAVVKNEKGVLKPDMFVSVTLRANLGQVISVPSEAVFFTGTANIVFVDQGNGLFEPREISLGQPLENAYEVKVGLKEGERVVTNGNFLVDSESRLKAALANFGESAGHQHG